MISLTRACASLAVAVVLLGGCGDDGGDSEASSESSPPSASASPSDAPSSSTAPPSTPPTSTTTSAAPNQTAAVGELVEGFPTDLLPVPEGAQVQASAVVPSGDVRTVTLVVSTDLAADAAVQLYRDTLAAAGFTESAGALPAGVVGAGFTRSEGRELITVAVAEVDGRRTVTVGGTLLR